MSALSELLERLRRVRLPPGAAAGVVAVPSAGDELAHEVAFLFDQLDQIEQRGELVLSASETDAFEIEATAAAERRRILDDARAEAERAAAELLARRSANCRRLAREMLADAEREAELVATRGRERSPALVQEVIGRVLEGQL